MADPEEDKLDLESAVTQADSSSEEKTPEEGAEKTVSRDAKKPDPDAVSAWDSLSGSTQERVVELVRRAKQAEMKMEEERLKAEAALRRAPETPKTDTPSEQEVKEALNKLREFGVVTKEDLQAVTDRMYLEREHDRLERQYDGSDGRPKYVREEVEDYARTHYFGGNLEAAYKDMYWDELIDAEVKAKGSGKSTYTERPTTSVKVGEKPLTKQSLRERLREPDGAEWWLKNREKIEPLLDKLA
jgi:hypothetical protein